RPGEAPTAPSPVRTPMVDVNTSGAGGGSIAWIDAAGGLRVGPRSAGAEPGPACYGRGGDAATVTDASVVLGYLNPERFAGGALTLDVGAAERAVGAIGRRLGVDTITAAAGIHRVINARMADQIRLVTIKRGYDPRQFALLVLGGAGPVHGVALAEGMGMAEVVVREAPGVLAAFGLLSGAIVHHHGRTSSVSARRVRSSPSSSSICPACIVTHYRRQASLSSLPWRLRSERRGSASGQRTLPRRAPSPPRSTIARGCARNRGWPGRPS